MKIKSVLIKNFRNIKESKLDFSTQTNIISGVNGIGKSNSLNALMWFFTDTLLTDKYGSGENDIASIVPSWYEKRKDPEVTVELVSDTNPDITKKYTKVYRTTYQRGTDIINGHTTDYYINDVKQPNSTEFNDDLYKALNYTPCFNKLKIKEINAFIDPLYLLQKLDPKELRNFLVAVGCSVSDEELFQQGFEGLRKYQEKYNSKWDLMRKDLKKQRDTLIKDIENKEAALEPFNDVEEFKPDKLNQLKQEQANLSLEKATISKGELSSQIQDLKVQMKDKAVQINALRAKKQAQKDAELAKLAAQIKEEESSLQNKKMQATASVSNDLRIAKSNLLQAQEAVKRAEEQKATYLENMQMALDAAKLNSARIRELTLKKVQINDRKFVDFITCPHCGERINIGDEEQFNKDKALELANINAEIQSLAEASNKHKNVYDSNNLKVKATIVAIEKEKEDVARFEKSVEEFQTKLNEINLRDVDTSILNGLKATYQNLSNSKIVVSEAQKLNEEYIELDNKVKALESQNAEAISEQINVINSKIEALEAQIKEEYIKENKWQTRLNYEKMIQASQEELNNVESLLSQVNDFIHLMIQSINEKATKKLGIEFRMLEENLTNDGVTEVCYAVIDDVPFASVNTSEKIKWGIKVIEKIKDIAVDEFNVSRNQLPIIADRLEAVDDVNKIKTFTQEQFICSRVSNENQITIM